ncbi:hypothetical protein TNCT_493251 [Trichonephila clavata]|uniref:TIL domain-containing protein n=1 Tax=Trichonephila clavata TaxID=2740835 RepID=A0A8X6FJP5_TRICU|nr:hypothetical protein TNCT_493251 [Trichonephila clavata]
MRKCKLLLGLCLVLLSTLQCSNGQYVPANEQFVECVNPCNTCQHGGAVCINICIPGWDCLPGHLRNEFDLCVPRRFCKSQY